MTSRPGWAFFLLCAAVAAGFGLQIRSLGFYNDDYAWLPPLASAAPATLWNLCRSLFLDHYGDFVARPSIPVYIAVLFRLCGQNPVLHQSVFLLIDAAIAWNFYRLLVEEGVSRPSALSAAVLAALYPNHDATHHWMTNSVAPLALAGTLWAVRAWRRGEREGSAVFRVTALLSYLFFALLYEASALLALLPAVLEAWRLHREGRSPVSAAKGALSRHWPPAACLAAVVAYQRVLIPAILHSEKHAMSLPLMHVWKVFQAGVECTLLNRLTHLVARSAQYALREFGGLDWLAFSLAALLLAGWDRAAARTSERPSEALPVLAAAFFVLGYAPYIFDPTYTPTIFNPTNRVNLVASLGGAAFWAWLTARLRTAERPRTRTLGGVLSILLLSGFLLCDQVSGLQWARAAGLQREILSGLDPLLAGVEGPVDLLLYGIPERIGSGTVFESTYDFNGALRLRTAREDLQGRVGQGRVRFEKGRAVLSWYGETPLSYERLHVYDASRKNLVRIPDKAAGDAFLLKMN